MPVQIKAIDANRFTRYIKPDDKENLPCIYRWAAWFAERRIPFLLFETHNGFAIWKLPVMTLVCESCKTEFDSHEGHRKLCLKCSKIC